jgi:lysophospholipase L1-like esterase
MSIESRANKIRMRICILGNSVGLRIRPPRRARTDRTYSEWLMLDHEVFNCCRAGTVIGEQFRSLEEDLLSRFPDVAIINFGIVEIFDRQTIRRINNFPIRNYYNNSVYQRDFRPRAGILDFTARGMNYMTRLIASRFGVAWQWVRIEDYLAALRYLCDIAVKETHATVIIFALPIFPAGSEKYSVTTNEHSRRVNACIRAWADESGGRIRILPTDSLTPDSLRHQRIMPDGIHFSGLGHRIIYKSLYRLIGECSRPSS